MSPSLHRSFYYCTTFLSTVGFGDVTATTDAERVVASIMMVIGESSCRRCCLNGMH